MEDDKPGLRLSEYRAKIDRAIAATAKLEIDGSIRALVLFGADAHTVERQRQAERERKTEYDAATDRRADLVLQLSRLVEIVEAREIIVWNRWRNAPHDELLDPDADAETEKDARITPMQQLANGRTFDLERIIELLEHMTA